MTLAPDDTCRLSKHAKWRLEDGYVLLCHCKYLQDFKLPIRYATLLKRLERGITLSGLDDQERLVVKDLRSVGLLDEGSGGTASLGRGSQQAFAATVWDRMGYTANL
jgi:hypothetical protein